jgi:thiol-disulfide isomerase/thioredoxin
VRDLGVAVVLALAVREFLAVARAPGVQSGTLAPSTSGVTLTGQPFRLEQLQGKPVFVNLWATWCPPCRAELPDLARAAKAHPEVQFVGLTMSSSKMSDARTLITEAGVGYEIVFIDAASEARWKVSTVPSSVLLDKDGRIVWMRAGEVDEGDVAAAINALPQ